MCFKKSFVNHLSQDCHIDKKYIFFSNTGLARFADYIGVGRGLSEAAKVSAICAKFPAIFWCFQRLVLCGLFCGHTSKHSSKHFAETKKLNIPNQSLLEHFVYFILKDIVFREPAKQRYLGRGKYLTRRK